MYRHVIAVQIDTLSELLQNAVSAGETKRAMISGHVDRLTRQFVAGWAADQSRPDEAIDVVIIANGQKIAQVTCDALRTDLRNLGIYGDGRHGFHHEFSPPFPDDIDLRIAVRTAQSGSPLGNSDLLLQKNWTVATTVAPPNSFELPAPADPAALLQLLGMYDESEGIPSLLCRVDFRGVRRAQLEYAAFGDLDCMPAPGGSWTEQIARDYLDGLLHSPRFQSNILAQILRAFPDKRRVIFVHIPKCAGSDLASHLAVRYPFVTHHWREDNWTDKRELFSGLARLVRELPFSDSILMSGHVSLTYYTNRGLIRPTDRVFTVVRDPVEIALSAVNYVVTRLEANVRTQRLDPDVKGWMPALGLTSLPASLPPEFISDISARALRHPEINQANPLCHWLGGGDAEKVIARLAQHHVEVTNTAQYSAWLANEWGITTRSRMNVSTKYLTLGDLTPRDLEYVRTLSPEDRKLYDLIDDKLSGSGRNSIHGEDLLYTAEPEH